MNPKQKKPYEPPKIYRVQLNQEQAILAGCLAGATAISNLGAAGCTAACRRTSATGGNSGPSSS